MTGALSSALVAARIAAAPVRRPADPVPAWLDLLTPTLAERLARRYGTPLYLYSLDHVRARCEALTEAFPRARAHYAMKANACPALLAEVRRAGLGIDAVSPWEVRLAREVGFKKKQIIYSGNNPSRDELAALVRAGVMINVDALSALARLGEIRRGTAVSLRINPEIGDGHHPHVITAGADSKFGLAPGDLPEARRIATRFDLRVVGLHQHIGSGLFDLPLFERSLEPIAQIASEFPALSFVDVGGGFGVPYRAGEEPVDLPAWGSLLSAWVAALERRAGRPLELLIEPGRYVVAEAGALLARVTTVKRTSDRVFVGVDSGMHHLVRPAMYGSYHALRVLGAPRAGVPERCFVVGPICESGDVLAEDRMMVAPAEGELLALTHAGAYGYAMSSHYNLRPRPAEVVLEGARPRLARPRETYRDVVRRRDVKRAR